MNDEEKYKKALEKAKALYGSSEPMSGCSVILEIIFPELNEDEDEDEKVRKAIINAIHNYAYRLEEKIPTEWFAWLEKQARQKYTQKDVDYAYLKGVNTTKRMFEKQKAKKEAEQKPVWSENDERICRCLIRKQEELIDTVDNPILKEIYRERMDWLKSLEGRVQPQKQWKPSDEQMMALRWVLNHIPYDSHKEEISGLLEQLKKLKEELV